MNIYFVIILSFILAQFLFKVVIEWVNLFNITDKLPPLFAGECSPEKYKTSQNYLKENTRLSLAQSGFFTLLLFVFILFGYFNKLDLFVRSFGFNEITTGLFFLGILYLGLEILELPFDIYDTFVIEEKYGFNRTTPQIFILDFFKKIALEIVFGGLVLAGLIWFFQTMGPYAWVYAWIALVAFQLVMTYIAPTFIMPLFNKFTPLEEGDLRKEIQEYANKVKFSLQGIYKMDGSKRSTKENAFFTGFGNSKRIVLFDTLIAKYSIPELTSILAHEMGHYKKKHIIKMLAINILMSGIMLFLLSVFLNNPKLFEAFGMQNLSVYASLLFFSMLFSPAQMILAILSNYLSRKYEYEADAFSITTYKKPEAMVSALKKLALDNMVNLTPHPWKVAVSYSHPPITQRIERLKAEG